MAATHPLGATVRRALIQVVGPSGAGASTLIERLLRSNRSRAIGVVSFGPSHDVAGRADERERFVTAGATVATVGSSPGGDRATVWDVLEEHDGLLACDVVLIEGGPVERRDVDLVAFVAPPLLDGETLLVDERREVDRVDGALALALALGWDPSDVEIGTGEFDTEEEADQHAEEDVEVVETFELSDRAAAAIRRLLDEGLPAMLDGAWLRAGWEALAEAELAVVNVRTRGQLAAAHATRAAIEGLRANERWRVGAVRRRHDAGPRRCHVGDLGDARDDGTRRLIEAIKRRWS